MNETPTDSLYPDYLVKRHYYALGEPGRNKLGPYREYHHSLTQLNAKSVACHGANGICQMEVKALVDQTQ